MLSQYLTTVEECVCSFTCIVSIYIKCTLPQHREVEILVIYSQIQTTSPSREVLTDYIAVSSSNLTITVQVLVLDVTQLFSTCTLRQCVQFFLSLEQTICYITVERTDRITFQTPELRVARVNTFSTAHVGNFILHVCHVEVNGIAPILVDAVVVEDAQVETCIFHATSILCRSTHTNNTLNRQVKQHVVSLLLIQRKFKTYLVVQETSFDTKFVVSYSCPLQLVVYVTRFICSRIQVATQHSITISICRNCWIDIIASQFFVTSSTPTQTELQVAQPVCVVLYECFF